MPYENPVFYTIEFVRGDNYVAQVDLYLDDSALDLSSYEIVWAAKRSRRDPDSKAVVTKKKSLGGITLDGVISNRAFISLSKVETKKFEAAAEYVWDLRIQHTVNETIATPLTGNLMASRPVVRSVV